LPDSFGTDNCDELALKLHNMMAAGLVQLRNDKRKI